MNKSTTAGPYVERVSDIHHPTNWITANAKKSTQCRLFSSTVIGEIIS